MAAPGESNEIPPEIDIQGALSIDPFDPIIAVNRLIPDGSRSSR